MCRAPWLLALLLAAPLVLPPGQAGAPDLVQSPSDPRSFTWIVEGVLAVGGGGLNRTQVDWLHGQGFGAIANFRAEHEDPADHIRGKGMEFLSIPIDHAVYMNVSQLQQFVAWAKEQEAKGRPMYIHCTNGWHRAAAFAVAWEMERTGKPFDELGKVAEKRRPGTVMRAPAPLLAYESILTGKPGLTVMLQSDLSRPEPNGTMPVTVEVLAGSAPVVDAKVKVWSEESGLRVEGRTGPEGTFTFTYKAPPQGVFMDHLYARASFDGFVDGADNVELFYQKPVNPGKLEIDAKWTDRGIVVEVKKHGGVVPAHVLASTEEGWSWREMASHGKVLVPLPDSPRPVTIRAERWGAEGTQTVVKPPEPILPKPPKEVPDASRPPVHVDAQPSKEGDGTPVISGEATDGAVIEGPVDETPAQGGEGRPPAVGPRTSWAAIATGGLLVAGALALLMRRRRSPAGG